LIPYIKYIYRSTDFVKNCRIKRKGKGDKREIETERRKRRGSMGMSSTIKTGLLVAAPVIAILAIVTRMILSVLPRVQVPPHLANQPVQYVSKLIADDTADELRRLMKTMKEYPNNLAADLKMGGFKIVHEHIGEATPRLPNGRCAHPLMIPATTDPSICVLAGRTDVGKHFILTGGVDGKKEDFDDMLSRVSSFARYMFDLSIYPNIEALFETDAFQSAAKKTCPADQQYLDPFQFSFIIQVPGQTVALHLDGPYFWGATRFDYPQWLLVAMVYSNLFSEHFVNQVQVVGYLHEWSPTANVTGGNSHVSAGGEFIYFLNNSFMGVVQPEPQSAISVDGSKTVHAAKIFHPEVKAPKLDKDKDSSLIFVGGERWELQIDGITTAVYNTSDLRQTIVYRARCFHDAEEASKFRARIASKDLMKLDFILGKFVKDLIQRKKLTQKTKDTISRLDLAMLIMDTYVKYPLPAVNVALFPYNYCAVKKLIPSLTPLVSLVCK
jgi:hypothetical protein